jgi:hypothetical protein
MGEGPQTKVACSRHRCRCRRGIGGRHRLGRLSVRGYIAADALIRPVPARYLGRYFYLAWENCRIAPSTLRQAGIEMATPNQPAPCRRSIVFISQ